MKILIILALLAITFFGCDIENNNAISYHSDVSYDRINIVKQISTDTVIGRISNMEIVNNKVQFDIETKLASGKPFKMGSSTFTIGFDENDLNNPTLSNINPKYTVGNGTGYYNMMVNQFDNEISLQILYLYEPSSFLSNEFERIATITMDVNNDSFWLTWNREKSFMINPEYKKANFILNGISNRIKK